MCLNVLSQIIFASSSLWLVASAVTMECQYTMDSYEGKLNEILVDSAYTCFQAIVSDKCDNSNAVVAASRNHIEGKTRADVEMLYFKIKQNFPKLPTEIDKIFPNIVTLRLPKLGLEEISKEDLKFPKLKNLYLGHNNLKSLDSDLFEFTPNLEFVGFDFNQIENIGEKTFDSLSNLKIMYANANKCLTDEEAPRDGKIPDLTKVIKEKCSSSSRRIDSVSGIKRLKRSDSETISSDECHEMFEYPGETGSDEVPATTSDATTSNATTSDVTTSDATTSNATTSDSTSDKVESTTQSNELNDEVEGQSTTSSVNNNDSNPDESSTISGDSDDIEVEVQSTFSNSYSEGSTQVKNSTNRENHLKNPK